MAIEMKRCKVYPRNGLQFIPGILEKQKRIEFPAELPLSPHEIRRCLSYADVYEVRGEDDCVLLTLDNYLEDNTDATAATDVPDVELLYPRDEETEGGEGEEETDKEEEDTSSTAGTSQAATAATRSAKTVATNSDTVNVQATASKNNKYKSTPYTTNNKANTSKTEDTATAEESK